ncbi:hypothetical protein AMTR_s03187p00005950, partial [Amborella trichopoda]
MGYYPDRMLRHFSYVQTIPLPVPQGSALGIPIEHNVRDRENFFNQVWERRFDYTIQNHMQGIWAVELHMIGPPLYMQLPDWTDWTDRSTIRLNERTANEALAKVNTRNAAIRTLSSKILIEGDSILAISCLNRKCHIGWRMMRATYGNWALLRRKTWAANHVYREANGEADALAAHAMRKTRINQHIGSVRTLQSLVDSLSRMQRVLLDTDWIEAH